MMCDQLLTELYVPGKHLDVLNVLNGAAEATYIFAMIQSIRG